MTAEKSISIDQPLAPLKLSLVPDDYSESVTPFSHEANTACYESIAVLKVSIDENNAKIVLELEAVANLTKELCDLDEMIDDGVRVRGVITKRANAEALIHERYQVIAAYESDIAQIRCRIAELEAMRENLE